LRRTRWLGDRRSAGFGRRALHALGLAVLFGAAATSGVIEASLSRTATNQGAAGADSPSLVATAVPEESGIETAGAEGIVWDLPNLDHPRVDYWVGRFTTDKRGDFGRFLSRSGRYTPMISQKLAERGMPQDLIYLAMIESGFNPVARSPAQASGLWQFIAETGMRYGLDINRAVDERNDPVRSTDAALDYLTYLHGRFGSWYLAAAGYNTGENRVGRIMRQVTGSERGDEYSYYRIRDRLPRETRDYVPLMIAAARISKEPEKYGFADVKMVEPLRYDEVEVGPASSLAAIAQAAGTTTAELRQLNPHLKLNRTRNDRPSMVRIPHGSGPAFAADWPSVRQRAAQAQASPPASAPRVRQYRVRQGDNLTVIARRHGVTVNQLRQANGIRGDRIRAGSTLRIPG
jgi:membrane-bound lytic murein transglycosylase D